MTQILSLAGGFLLAVLWFDLMFDVQVLGAAPGVLPEETLASIAAYYARVTIDAAPMSRLVAAMMVIAVAGSLWRLVRRVPPIGLTALAFMAAAAPVALAATRVLPNVVRLGGRTDTLAVQSDLARAICWDHIACFASILLFCVLQVVAGRRDRQRALAIGAMVLVAFLGGCTVHQRPAPDGSGHAVLGPLPATFTGVLPCASCPGIRHRLAIFPDGTFFLRTAYLERDDEADFDDVGKWTVSADGRRLVLDGVREAPLRFRIVDRSTLRKLDVQGREIESKLDYDLRRSEEAPPETGVE
jgi:uncharacterized lipoprotein NlpE involved in copper resistance